ncbi:hypothetical protein BpHYR1_029257 [Brachionus plicatilis]|uniref:Uncharacterized protein n=1 Tax=Brachionus plicatilis TaxID=10195 RepID=A0A3M7S1Z4_BRAPC|nr:hypothetical protein BpHYR1_029257 [Brachionus plicatilis]
MFLSDEETTPELAQREKQEVLEYLTYTLHGNTRSPGYVLSIQWLSEIWEAFESHIIKNSFESCGITCQNSLHKTLKELVSKNLVFNTYIDNIEEEEAIMGFDDEDNFDENLEEENVSALNIQESVEIEPEQSRPTSTLQSNDILNIQLASNV